MLLNYLTSKFEFFVFSIVYKISYKVFMKISRSWKEFDGPKRGEDELPLRNGWLTKVIWSLFLAETHHAIPFEQIFRHSMETYLFTKFSHQEITWNFLCFTQWNRLLAEPEPVVQNLNFESVEQGCKVTTTKKNVHSLSAIFCFFL